MAAGPCSAAALVVLLRCPKACLRANDRPAELLRCMVVWWPERRAWRRQATRARRQRRPPTPTPAPRVGHGCSLSAVACMHLAAAPAQLHLPQPHSVLAAVTILTGCCAFCSHPSRPYPPPPPRPSHHGVQPAARATCRGFWTPASTSCLTGGAAPRTPWCTTTSWCAPVLLGLYCGCTAGLLLCCWLYCCLILLDVLLAILLRVVQLHFLLAGARCIGSASLRDRLPPALAACRPPAACAPSCSSSMGAWSCFASFRPRQPLQTSSSRSRSRMSKWQMLPVQQLQQQQQPPPQQEQAVPPRLPALQLQAIRLTWSKRTASAWSQWWAPSWC